MAGQIKTIQDAVTGKLRKTTPEEKAALLGKAASQETGLPEPSPFIKGFMDEGEAPAPEGGPQRLPPVAPEIEEAAGVAGAGIGAAVGGAPGAVAGGAIAAFLAGKAAEQIKTDSPIGTLEGGGAKQQDDTISTLKQSLAVLQQIERAGIPTQELTTNAAGSRL